MRRSKSDSASRELSRRERQIMDVIYPRERASAAEVREACPIRPATPPCARCW